MNIMAWNSAFWKKEKLEKRICNFMIPGNLIRAHPICKCNILQRLAHNIMPCLSTLNVHWRQRKYLGPLRVAKFLTNHAYDIDLVRDLMGKTISAYPLQSFSLRIPRTCEDPAFYKRGPLKISQRIKDLTYRSIDSQSALPPC